MSDPATFPDGDAALSQTFVFDHPKPERTDQVLVSLYSDGSVEVASRMADGQTWGAPWSCREVESWGG